MKYKGYIIITLMACGMAFSLPSCQDLDIAPMNIVKDDDVFSNEAGIRSYMARMYSEMPMEDFRYSHTRLFNHFWLVNPFSCISGEGLSRDVGGASTESIVTDNNKNNYWDDAYILIREANYFIETLPQYANLYSTESVDNWLGEAYFARAFAYYALAKRYGGVPLVDKVLNYPSISIDDTYLPRNSEEETWDFISRDFDTAIEKLSTVNARGRITKYGAAAFKSRAMLYAGSIAKYNTTSLFDSNNKRLCGIPADRAKDYFKQSYDAAKMTEGKYSLYMKDWKAGDKEAQYQNYVNLFFAADSPENILVKDYQYPETVHGWDAYNVPRQSMGPNGYSAEINPTLNFVEMFDGFEKDASGHFKNLDASGKYLMFDKTMDPFVNAEPRLRATVIFPGDVFKKENIEIRRGIYTGTVTNGIAPLLPVGSTEAYPETNLITSANASQTAYTLPNGTKMNPAGASGTFNSDGTCSISGFSIRKYLDPNRETSQVLENHSDQSWIEMRYAEVLLTRAEAAYELQSLGVTDGNYTNDAFGCINQLRERAGATLLASAGNLNLDVIRTERRKELGFEHKTYWDMKRWRVADKEQNSTLYRILMPFFAANSMKYFFDIRTDEGNRRYTFDTRWYYQQIPSGEITKNPKMEQNPGY